MSYLVAGLLLGFLIMFHEFGHYWVARRTGMRVERFSIGFGPVITSWQRGETEFALSWVPLGGYVKIAGMATEDEVKAGDKANYGNKPAWQRFLVIFAGPTANYLMAYVIGVGMMMTVHKVPEPNWARLGQVVAGMPAAQAGLKQNDDIVSIDGVEVHDWEGLINAIAAGVTKNPGKPFPVVFRRDGKTARVALQPRDAGGGTFQIGVGRADRELAPVGLATALADSARNIWTATEDEVTLFHRLLTGKASVKMLSGPVGIISATASAARESVSDLVHMVWLLSIAVGFINLLPIPGLDGGRCVFLIYELVSKRRINQTVEGWIHGIGLLALFALILFVSYGDVMRVLGIGHHG